jgi:signal transduction histidine kinase
MPNSSRRSGASATASGGDDPFSRARLKLSLFYLGIIVVIVAVLSAAVYAVHSGEVRESAHRRVQALEEHGIRAPIEAGLLEEEDGLRRAILLGDAVTVAAAGALSYLLAGRTLRPIRVAMDTQKRFFADAAHDLRTPLAAMRTEAEVALDRRDLSREEAVRVISSHLEEIGRLSAMVDQMLALVRGAGGASAPRQRVPLVGLASGVVAKLAAIAERRGVRLAFAGGGDGAVRGDPAALERALVNVIENAIVYTPPGGSVRVEVGRVGSRLELRTSDDGMGIAAEDLPHVVEPFFRADKARTANEAGCGLGLTIAARIVEDHQGAMQVVSEQARGTTVTMRFPAA